MAESPRNRSGSNSSGRAREFKWWHGTHRSGFVQSR
jgi:hypothetical protein